MFDDWLDILLGGTFEVDLPTLVLAQGDSVRFSGSGRLVWQADSPLRVVAVTNGAEFLRREIDRAGIATGQLIPRGTYLSATGHTQDGWDISTDPVPLHGYRVSFDSPHVIWDLATSGVSLARSSKYRGHRVLRALLGPPPTLWTRGTETEVRNEYFGYRVSRLDWLLARTQFGPVAAQQRTDQWFEVRVVAEGAPPRPRAIDILTAVIQAFGFVLGRRLVLRGFDDHSPGRESRHLTVPGRGPTKNLLLVPIGKSSAYLAAVEALLGQAIDFFLTDQGERVAQHLYLCWDTADNALPTRLAVASICVEGLLRLASEASDDGDSSYTPADVAAVEQWLAAPNVRLSSRFVKRLRGFLENLGQRRPQDVLWDWQGRGVLGVSANDIDAWERTRHPAAHAGLVGSPPDHDELQARVSRFFRVLNLMNRIILQMMGYRGTYVDYAQPGWPETEFPAAPLRGYAGTSDAV